MRPATAETAGAPRDSAPVSALPLAYVAFAHAALGAALLVLVVRPGVPGGFFYHPRMVALVHAVTIAWLSGSILGAFYIVAPLALRMPMPAFRADWAAFAGFAIGSTGMITHFWMGEYVGMAWSAALVVPAIAWVGARALRGLTRAAVPSGVKLHVALAFVNVIGAALVGMALGVGRARGAGGFSPMAAAFAHAHLAAIGWVAMMVIGLAYRLIPMMLPAAMPSGRSIAASALLIQAGIVMVFVSLIRDSRWLGAGAVVIAAGLASFAIRMRLTVRHRLPRPPALPARDWSAWQAHAALAWLVIAAALGLSLSLRDLGDWRVPLMWWYGVAGFVGFLAQMVAGIQGRLLPIYAWYRERARLPGEPPVRGAHERVSAPFARAIFLGWAAGVPLLGFGLAHQHPAAVAAGAACLLAAIAVGGAYIARMLRQTPA